MIRDFKEEVVVITGAASGMGRAYALAFAREGARLALCDVDGEGLKETVASLAGFTTQSPLVSVFDISEEDAMFAFAEQVKQTLGPALVLINNAGIEGSAKPVWTTSRADFERVMGVNYFGVVHGTRAFLPQMMAENRGAIVNVSSIFGLVGTPNHADYCGSKFAVRGFTEALMVELIESPIQVHLLHPGGIRTNIARQSHSQNFAQHFFKTTPEQVATVVIRAIRKNTPRIVYGHGATKTWLGERLLPLKWLKHLLWSELKPVIDRSDYPKAR